MCVYIYIYEYVYIHVRVYVEIIANMGPEQYKARFLFFGGSAKHHRKKRKVSVGNMLLLGGFEAQGNHMF